jgi:hypothetical protein
MASASPANIALQLLDARRRVAAGDFAGSAIDVTAPGLYAWFVDDSGADDLTRR